MKIAVLVNKNQSIDFIWQARSS